MAEVVKGNSDTVQGKTTGKVRAHQTQNERLVFEESAPGKKAYKLPPLDVPAVDPAALFGQAHRNTPGLLPELSEIEIIRHFTRLSTNGLPASSLTLEITETEVMADIAEASDVLGQLADLGVRIAVDDYGTGYSSLAYLHRLPANELKLDRSFVANVAADRAIRSSSAPRSRWLIPSGSRWSRRVPRTR